MTAMYYKESPADQAAMQALRAELRLHPPLELGPEARPVYDELIAGTPAAENLSCEAANVGKSSLLVVDLTPAIVSSPPRSRPPHERGS